MKSQADAVAFSSRRTQFADTLKGKSPLVLWEEAYREIHIEPEKG